MPRLDVHEWLGHPLRIAALALVGAALLLCGSALQIVRERALAAAALPSASLRDEAEHQQLNGLREQVQQSSTTTATELPHAPLALVPAVVLFEVQSTASSEVQTAQLGIYMQEVAIRVTRLGVREITFTPPTPHDAAATLQFIDEHGRLWVLRGSLSVHAAAGGVRAALLGWTAELIVGDNLQPISRDELETALRDVQPRIALPLIDAAGELDIAVISPTLES